MVFTADGDLEQRIQKKKSRHDEEKAMNGAL